MTKKVMVVDDDPGVIFTMKRGMEGLDKDFEITTVSSGTECIELLENNQIPDLILLDIMMPDISGWEVYKKIKGNDQWKNIPVVFLTARTDRMAKEAGGFLGEDYIEKPFKLPELKERIDKILKK
jgi:CheY-like chemotaxis protein